MRKFLSVLLTLAMVNTAPLTALADDIYNNLDGSIDASLETLALPSSGPAGTVVLQVRPQNGDGKNGCNLTAATTLVVGVQTSNPTVATVSPTTITFTSCGDARPVTVMPHAAGSATIFLTELSNTTGGSFNLLPASFTVNVTAPVDHTGPTIVPHVSPAVNSAGWHNQDVSVSWTVTDPESPVTSMTGCDSQMITEETAGLVLTCTATSMGGTTSQSVTIRLDKTKPVVTGIASPAANAAGWNNSDVNVHFLCDEAGTVQSGIVRNTVSGGVVTTEGMNQSLSNSGNCVDAAGNVADMATVSGINIDKTKPVITGMASPAANAAGWNNTDVAVNFSCAEVGMVQSGLDTNTVAGATLTGEGMGQSVTNSGACADLAGNMADGATVSGINIDKTKPVIVGMASPAANAAGWNNTDVAVGFTCSDIGSGITMNTVAGATLTMDGAGQSVTNTGSCVDAAGNIADAATVSGINIDKTAPEVAIVTPADGAHYTFHATVLANWSATDVLSGITSSSGTVPSGSPISTNVIGTYAFTVMAMDVAGNMVTHTVYYTVDQYIFGGLLAPVSIDSKTFKKTSTIPVKFQLRNSTGGYVTNAVGRLYIDPTAIGNGVPAVSSGSSNDGSLFRYDLSGNQYIFNLSTSMPVLSVGTHRLRVVLDDGTRYDQTIVIR